MSDPAKRKLSTEPYKGVRDFYPEDMFIQNYLFSTMRECAERFGYSEYSASLLEPSELYEAKTSEEIVSEQTYTFIDRGNRSVTLRPEMTPTLARMVAAQRRELPLPLRWYSIPNVFRYERPQRGRLREHWQLNCDIFGVTSTTADAEIIMLAAELLRSFGATDEQFEIGINHRVLLNSFFNDVLKLSQEERRLVSRLIDRKNKMSEADFESEASSLLGNRVEVLSRALNAPSLETYLSIAEELKENAGATELATLIQQLRSVGVHNIRFDPTLVRGFDYYTGMVFEIFDRSPENRRSLFGGGRYDHLLDIFGVDPLPAVGFGMGDVTLRDFLDTYKLLPAYVGTTELFVCTVSTDDTVAAQALAQFLREKGLAVGVNLLDRKVGDQIKSASKQSIPFIITVGESERSSGRYKLKHLGTGEEKEVSREEIADTVFSFIG